MRRAFNVKGRIGTDRFEARVIADSGAGALQNLQAFLAESGYPCTTDTTVRACAAVDPFAPRGVDFCHIIKEV